MRKGNLIFFLRNNEIGIKFLVLINAWRFQSTFCLGRNKLCSYIKTAEVGKLFHDDEIKRRERGKKKKDKIFNGYIQVVCCYIL